MIGTRKRRRRKKGTQWYFGKKAHTGVNAHSGLVHTVVGTTTDVHVDVLNVAGALPHGQACMIFEDAGYQIVHKRAKATRPTWHVAMRAGQHSQLSPFSLSLSSQQSAWRR